MSLNKVRPGEFFQGETGGKYGGQETRARATLQQYGQGIIDDTERFRPTLDSLLDLENEDSAIARANEAGGRARLAYDAQMGAADRRLQSLGLNPTRASGRRRGLGRILADVNSRNKSMRGSVNRRDANRDMAFDIANIQESGILGALGNAANMEGTRDNAYRAARIGNAGSQYNTLGSLVGFAGGFI